MFPSPRVAPAAALLLLAGPSTPSLRGILLALLKLLLSAVARRKGELTVANLSASSSGAMTPAVVTQHQHQEISFGEGNGSGS